MSHECDAQRASALNIATDASQGPTLSPVMWSFKVLVLHDDEKYMTIYDLYEDIWLL